MPKPIRRPIKMTITKEGQPAITTSFKMMDELDTQAIQAELSGVSSELAKKYVYEVIDKKSGKIISQALTYSGVKVLVQYMNKKRVARIAISSEHIPEPKLQDGVYMAMAYAQDLVNGTGQWGCGVNKTTQTVWNFKVKPAVSREIPDSFAMVKAVSKAQRNALRAMIPEDLIAKQMTAFLKKPSQVHRVELTEAQQREVSNTTERPTDINEAFAQAIERTTDPRRLTIISVRIIDNKVLTTEQKEMLKVQLNLKADDLRAEGK